MPERLYTQGEAISLAGRILARIVEIMGMIFFLLVKICAAACRGVFAGAGLFMDGYNAISNRSSRRVDPELRIRMEEAVILAADESKSGWHWIEETMAPVKQILASTQSGYKEKSMKKNEIIRKDQEAVVMAQVLKKIVFEVVMTTASCQPLDAFMRNKEKEAYNEPGSSKISMAVKQELLKYITTFRFATSKCPDDPIRKAALLVKFSTLTLKYHRTGSVRLRKKMQETGNRLV